MKLLLLAGMASVFGACGCGTFSGAGQDAVQNFEQGVEGRGRLISPSETGDRFGSYYQ